MSLTSQSNGIRGADTVLSMGKESSFGTAATPTLYLPFTKHDIMPSNKIIANTTVRGSYSAPKPGIGSVEVKGTVSLDVDAVSIGPVMGAAMGNDTVSGPTAGVYTHTMKMGGPLNSYSFGAYDNNGSTSTHVGCKIDSLSISCKPDDFLAIDAAIIGQTTVVSATTLSASLSTLDPFEWDHLASLNGALGVTTVNGVPVNMNDLSISYKTNLMQHWGSLSGRVISSLDEKNREVTGSFTTDYDSNIGDAMNLLLWGSTTGPSAGAVSRVPLVITFTQSASASLSFSLGQVTISDITMSRSQNDIVTQQIKFTASESTPEANDALQVILKNTVANNYYSGT
jgi:hypothetical protein